MCYLVWENKKIRNFEKEHVAVLTCMSGTSPGNMRSKHTSLIYFPTCTGDLIYIPFHWCVCDAFGVPQPDAWPGIGPQPFVAKTPKDELQHVKVRKCYRCTHSMDDTHKWRERQSQNREAQQVFTCHSMTKLSCT